ncbi:MAG TPA: EAL domain-containing protein, partial [Burkholderiales bacterium]|nr:EAL domain-containing protein [Burkholderiales bacterium]
ESGGYCQAWVGLAQDDADKSIGVGGEAGCEPGYFEAHKGTWADDGRHQGVMGHVIATGRAYTSQNMLTESRFLHRRERAAARGYQSAITLPLRIDGRSAGGLSIYAFEPDAFDTEEVALLEELAEDIAYGIQSFRTRSAHSQVAIAAQENEERYRTIFDNAAVGITRVDLNGILTDANQKFLDMLGYSREELLGRAVKDITHPDDYGRGAGFRERLAYGAAEAIAGEKRFFRKDGKVVWARRTMSVVCNDAGKPEYLVSVVEDITAHKETEERYRATFDGAPVGIMHTAVENGAILHVNPKLCEILGYTREELLGMTTADIPHPDFAGLDHGRYPLMLEGKMSSFASERLFLRKDGSSVWVNRTVSLVRDSAGNALYFIRIVEDISDRKRAELALRESEGRFRQLADNIPEAFWIADVEMRELLYLSPVYEKVTGKPVGKIMKNPHRCLEVVHPDDRRRVRTARRLLPYSNYNIEYRVVCPDGSLRWIHDQAYPVRDGEGRIYRIAGIAADITERKAAEEKLVYLAHYDDLTGLPNRILFRDRLEQTLSQARRRNWLVGVMMLDLDRFKVANDSLGHSVGDALLKQVADRLADCVRVGDTVGRFGGDEFGIVLSDLRDAEDVRLVAQKTLEAFSKPFQLNCDEVYITASIGISMYPTDSDDLEVLIKSADTALHRAKDSGRNNFQFFTAEMNDKVLHRLSMDNSLRRALERGEFLLHYQPKVALDTGVTTGLEALLRWQHPELGLVPPGEFVPLLEETGLIIPVGEWIFGAVCGQLKAWEAAGIQCVPIAVNLSSRQFLTRGFGGYVQRLLEKHGVDPRLIELEITESSLMANTEDIVDTLRYLESIGVRIAIDDFGTGYSSLSYLKRFPLDALKIDGSFVQDITSNADDAAIVRAIISMARSLGLKIVAEGVETEAQMNFLASSGCDEIQGYFLSRPMTSEDSGKWLRRKIHLPDPPLRGTAPAVLLVDDDDDMLVLLARALGQDGYYILTANCAREAFDILSRHRVDMVISDQQMPGMSGVELLQRIKSLYPDTVRVMCSGLADFQTVTEAVNKGEIFRFLPKSMEQERLRSEVRDALSNRASAAVGAGSS